jgi:predicted amidohydrolase
MWENAFYIGGHDNGVIAAGGLTVGAAVCWELMRMQTVHRLRGRIDLAMTGSGWWAVPRWHPQALFRWLETRNAATAQHAAASFAGYVGAPVLHAAHAGALRCRMPWLPIDYSGRFEGGTMIVAADGTVLASCDQDEGAGVVVADVDIGRRAPKAEPPERFGCIVVACCRPLADITSDCTAGAITAVMSPAQSSRDDTPLSELLLITRRRRSCR